MLQSVGGKEGAGRASAPPVNGVVPFVALAETPDTTIRVLEMPGARGYWFADLAADTPEGLARRRHTLGEGPWLYEPDCVSLSRLGGLGRVLVRRASGVWGGRIQIPEGHPLFDRPITTPVYGGHAIQFVGAHPVTGESFRHYGFACDAPKDCVPSQHAMERLMGGAFTYRDVWFAARELVRLSAALLERGQ